MEVPSHDICKFCKYVYLTCCRINGSLWPHNLISCLFVSPSRAPTSPPHPTLVPALHLDEEFTELEKLAIVWEDCHIAYYESMDFKEKIDKREASVRTSQVFWSAFENFCKDVLQNSNSSEEVFDACMNVQKRRQLRRGISMSESILSKLTQYNSISMYSDTDFKIEFELQARRFWMDWVLLEAAIERCSPGPVWAKKLTHISA